MQRRVSSIGDAAGHQRAPPTAADSQAALGCISFPSIARLQPEGGTAVRSIPLMWHKRSGGFAGRPRPGVLVAFLRYDWQGGGVGEGVVPGGRGLTKKKNEKLNNKKSMD